MADNRATLKAFFNTGDIPTEAQFASLIDSLLSLEDDSNLKNRLSIKSQTDGKMQITISDDDFNITNDGDVGSDQVLSLGTGGALLSKRSFGGFFVDTPLPIVIGFHIRAIGKLAAIGLETFANNAAALAGGLIINDIYKTATGELRIVV